MNKIYRSHQKEVKKGGREKERKETREGGPKTGDTGMIRHNAALL